MKTINRKTLAVPNLHATKILQFGGGNFLRGYFDWMIDLLNEKTSFDGGVVIVKPTKSGNYNDLRSQDGLFHVAIKGIVDGSTVSELRLITAVQRVVHPYKEWAAYLETALAPDIRFIVSNTTEAGIRFVEEDFAKECPVEFPAKLTRWLYKRYAHFEGHHEKGCIVLPLELVIDNGDLLREAVIKYAKYWALDDGFAAWILNHNIFCNTLVDRIVPGYPNDDAEEIFEEIGSMDNLLVMAEPFHLFAIQAPSVVAKALPLDTIGLNVVFTDDLAPYRSSKVRMLNGVHTAMVPVGYLLGLETVREVIQHPLMSKYIEQLMKDEIIPTLNLPGLDLSKYASDIFDRFRNPFIRHELLSISLNSISKFATRLLPTLRAFHEAKNQLPSHVVFSMAALIRFYGLAWQGQKIPLKDDAVLIDFFKREWNMAEDSFEGMGKLVTNVLANEALWGTDLNSISGLKEKLAEFIFEIRHKPFDEVLRLCIG